MNPSQTPPVANLPLHDIHLPDAVSWWPPALGWWLLLSLSVGLLLLGVVLWQRLRRRRYRRLALQRLAELEQEYAQEQNSAQLLQGLSRLLRQAAQLHFPQRECAGLVGEEWLRFLDQQLSGEPFSQGVGQVLADAPYRRHAAGVNAAALCTLCRSWLRRLPLAPKTAGGKR